MEESSIWGTFDVISLIKVGAQPRRKDQVSAKSRNSAKVNVKSLSDDDSYDEEENISENGDEKDICFLVIPTKTILKKTFGS